MDKPLPSAREKALQILDRSVCSKLELEQKLRRAGYPAEASCEAAEYCRARGFINDELLAEDQTRLLLERGCGVRRIAQKLRQKGVASSVVQAALSGTQEAESAAARTAADYKLRLLTRESDPRKKREKLLRFLLGRGFSLAVARRTLAAALNSGGDAESDGTSWSD